MRKYSKSRLDIYQIVVSLRILLRNYYPGRRIILKDLQSGSEKLEKCCQPAIKIKLYGKQKIGFVTNLIFISK